MAQGPGVGSAENEPYTRDMFEMLYESCGNEELLGCWLELEKQTGADVENAYESVWSQWTADPQSQDVASLAMNLFTFLYFCGKINSFGESLVRFTLNARRDELGIDDAEVAQCVNDLGVVLHEKGHSADAEALYRQALEIRERVLGPDVPRPPKVGCEQPTM